MLNKARLTVIPNHQFILGVSRDLAAPNYGNDVGFMDHLNDADTRSEFSRDD